MSYSKERDEFISRATKEGLSLDTCRKLLRYATTLQAEKTYRIVEKQAKKLKALLGDSAYKALLWNTEKL